MKKIVAGLVVLLAVAGIGFKVFGASTYRLAAVAPANTTVWVEVRDLRETLAAFRQSPSYQDYTRSKTKKQVDQAWEQLSKLNESEALKEWKDLGLPLEEESLLLGLGEYVGLGAIARPDGPPSAFVATKLDMLGIAKKVATGGDWSKAWEKLRGVLGGKDAKVEPYQGYDLVSRKVDEKQEVHFCLLRDVLVASIDKDTVKSLIEVQAGTRESLARRAAFRNELDGLENGHVGYAWVDMELVRDQKKLVDTVKQIAERVGAAEAVKAFDGEELAVLRQDLKPVDSLAFGLYLPKGDVYAAHVEASRAEADLFKDVERHDLRGLVGEDTFVYVEARGLYETFRRISDSKALAALKDAQATKWLREQMEKPGELTEMLQQQAQAPVKLDADPTFELGLALNVIRFPLREVLGNDLALAVEQNVEGKTPEEMFRPLGFVRTRPIIRIATDVATGVFAKQAKAMKDGPFEVSTHGERTIYGLKQQPVPVYWTQVGAELAISTQKDMLQRVIDRTGAKGAATDFQRAMKRLPEGYAAFMFINMSQYQKLLDKAAGGGNKAEMEKLQKLIAGQGSMAWAAYVDEPGTSYTLRTWQELTDQLDPSLRKAYEAASKSGDKEPAGWARLPEETFVSAVGETDSQALWDYGVKLATALSGEQQVKDALAAFSKEYLGGQEPQAALVAPLAGDAAFGILSQPKLGEGPQLVAVPAGVLALELDDAAAATTFEKALVTLLETGLKKVNARALAAEGDEAYARMTLMQLRATQQLFRDADLDNDGEQDYGTLQDLVGTGHIDPSLFGGVSRGWVFDVRVSDFDWIATATRAEGGAEDISFLVNHGSESVMELKGPAPQDGFALPEGAVEFGTLPRPEVKVDPNDPRLTRLEKAQVAGVQGTRLVMPQEQADQAKAMVGGGFGPCFAVADGWIFFATSEHALGKALAAKADKGSVAAAPSFRKLISGHPTKVFSFGHLSWAGLAPQLTDNGELLAAQLAPLPKELQLPKRPEFPEVVEGQDFEKVFEKYKQDSEAYEKVAMEHHGKAAAWRKEHAAENAKALAGPLSELLGLMGGIISYGTWDADGKGMESVLEVRFDPSAVKPKN